MSEQQGPSVGWRFGLQLFNNNFISYRKKVWPWLAILLVLLATTLQLRHQGRFWLCPCGQFYFWWSNIWDAGSSQHLFDPYSFTHLLHGILFFWLLVWSLPQLSPDWRLSLAIFIEALWEMFENSELIIRRYRETTATVGYQGDAIVNSLSDILIIGMGFYLASYLGLRRSMLLFVVTEILLILTSRDSLILAMVMFVYPTDAIKAWQMAY